MSKNKGKKKSASIYLWKIVLIILALFVVFISVECFLLIERTAQKIILGFSKGLGTSIIADTEESASPETNEEGQNTNSENAENIEPSTDLNNGETITEDKDSVIDETSIVDKEANEDDKENDEEIKEETENKELDKDEKETEGKKTTENETEAENKEPTKDDITTDNTEIMSENEISGIIPLLDETFELGTIPGNHVKDYEIKTINMCRRLNGGGIILYNNTDKENATIRDLDLDKTISQTDKDAGIMGARFRNFPAVIAEKYENDGQNNFRVTKYLGPGELYEDEDQKYNLPIPQDGIIILFHDMDVLELDGSKEGLNIHEEDIIHVDFDYKVDSGYKESGYGKISVYRNENITEISYPVTEINSVIQYAYGASIIYNNKNDEEIKIKDIDVAYRTVGIPESKLQNGGLVLTEKVEGEENKFRVTKILDNGASDGVDRTKTNLTIPKGSIAIYFHDQELNRLWENTTHPDFTIGEIIEVDFNYKETSRGYNPEVYGYIKRSVFTNKYYEIHHINNISNDSYTQMRTNTYI